MTKTKRAIVSDLVYEDIEDHTTGQTIRVSMTALRGVKPYYPIRNRKRLSFRIDEIGKRGMYIKNRECDEDHLEITILLMPVFEQDQTAKVNGVFEKPFPTSSNDPDYQNLMLFIESLGFKEVPKGNKIVCLSLMPIVPTQVLRQMRYIV